MRAKQRQIIKIGSLYTGMHASYWTSLCAFSGFLAVYLGFYGFNDLQIGLTASLISVITLAFQLFISSYSDNHPNIPIKRILGAIYAVLMGMVVLLSLLPLPFVLMLIVYSMAGGLFNGIPGLQNALIIQFVNAGIRINFGWPRGMGALSYALGAYFIGLLLESYPASILMPICLVLLCANFFFTLLLPLPLQDQDQGPIPSLAQAQARTSFVQLLKKSKVLLVFLVSGVFMNAGSSNVALFLPRIIESNGGSKAELGLAMLIQAGVEVPMMLASPWLMRRFRLRNLLSLSLIAYVIKAGMIVFLNGMTSVYLAMAVSILCFGIYCVCSVYFVSDIVAQNEMVRAQTLVMVSSALAAILSNLVSGYIVNTFGISRLNQICLLLQLIAAALMLYSSRLQQGEEAPALKQTGL